MNSRAAFKPAGPRAWEVPVGRIPELDPGQPVLVALSGGLDSVVLLHMLRFRVPQLQVVAAHFDHGMRSESGEDARWVRGLCRAWEIPLVVEASSVRLAGEAAARESRYAFLERASGQLSAQRILTAHHANDQAETVILRLLRGTGVDGLSGIAGRRGRILRPLLGFWRSDLEQYARTHGLRWREDSSNRDLRFRRNFVRHELLPRLERSRPGTTLLLLRLAHDATQAKRAWNLVVRGLRKSVVTAQTHDSVELARPRLLKYHPDIRARLLRHCAGRLQRPLSRAGTRVAEAFITGGQSGTGIALKGGLRVEIEFDTIRVLRSDGVREWAEDCRLRISAVSSGQGEVVIGGRPVRVEWSLNGTDEQGATAEFDPAELCFPLEVRAWQPGDRIRLSYGSKKLKKLFAERRLSRTARSTLPVVADGENNVLWVAGVARSELALPPTTSSVFQIRVRNGDIG